MADGLVAIREWCITRRRCASKKDAQYVVPGVLEGSSRTGGRPGTRPGQVEMDDWPCGACVEALGSERKHGDQHEAVIWLNELEECASTGTITAQRGCASARSAGKARYLFPPGWSAPTAPHARPVRALCHSFSLIGFDPDQTRSGKQEAALWEHPLGLNQKGSPPSSVGGTWSPPVTFRKERSGCLRQTDAVEAAVAIGAGSVGVVES